MAKLLIVDDDVTLLHMVKTALQKEHVIETAVTGKEASELLRFYTYDIVVLDLNLPDRNGIDICRDFRSSGGRIPVLMLTGKNETSDKERGLEAGADDYLTKPFDLRELRVRLTALLRRSPFAKKITRYGDWVLDLEELVLRMPGRDVKLLRREVQVVEMLMRSAGEYLSTETLLAEIWGDSNVSASGLISSVKRIRDKVDIDGEPSFIETTPKLGYRLRSQSQQ